MIPDLTDEGFLPPGIYETTINEIIKKFGEGSLPRVNRANDLSIFHARINNYVDHLYIGGSFVSSKLAPNDVDVLVVYPDDFNWVSEEGRWISEKVLYYVQQNEEIKLHIYGGKNGDNTVTNILNTFQSIRNSDEKKGILFVECKND